MTTLKVGIVGFGRFGRFWGKTLKNVCQVHVYDKDSSLEQVATSLNLTFDTLETLCTKVDYIFLCVPINQLESSIQQILPLVHPRISIIDTCSVKVYPAQILDKYFSQQNEISLILTHPMFGPDSGAVSISGLPVVFWPLRTVGDAAMRIRELFLFLGLRVVDMSPEEHDRLAANSQGITHQIGRILGEMNLVSTPINTRGFEYLLSVIEQTCNDTWELFCDLQNYNPFTKDMRYRLQLALEQVNSRLLPDRISMDELIIGIQGGHGSFNEEACRYYCTQHAEEISRYHIEYLYTSDNVLTNLYQGKIDRGIFAIQNAKGGAVMETIHALSAHSCEILETFNVVISHCILHHPQVDFKDVDTLISHPQAIAQCSANLKKRYPQLNLINGEGNMVDQSLCAEYIASGKLPPTTAVLASRVCAQLYNLIIHDTDLQDLGTKNLTTFAWAQRRHY